MSISSGQVRSMAGSAVNSLWAAGAFTIGASLVLLMSIIISMVENATKERRRCLQCGYLSNRLGREGAAFLPFCDRATYHTYETRLSTYHNTWNTSEGDEWDTYGRIQVVKVSRRCGNVRSQRTISRKVGGYRRPRNDTNDMSWW